MSQLPALLTGEEVYDLDTFQLHDWKQLLEGTQSDDQQWNKKAKKLLELISLEIKERDAIENFAFNLKVDFQQNIYQNDALKAILDDIKNRPSNYLDFESTSAKVHFEEKIDKPPEVKVQQTQQSSHQSDTLSISTTTTHTRNIAKKKNNQVQDLMKNILEKTHVSNQQFVIGAPMKKYIPPPPKPQLSTVEKIKQEKLLRKKKKLSKRSESQKESTHLPQIINNNKSSEQKPPLNQSITNSKIVNEQKDHSQLSFQQSSLNTYISNSQHINNELNIELKVDQSQDKIQNINHQIEQQLQLLQGSLDDNQIKMPQQSQIQSKQQQQSLQHKQQSAQQQFMQDSLGKIEQSVQDSIVKQFTQLQQQTLQQQQQQQQQLQKQQISPVFSQNQNSPSYTQAQINDEINYEGKISDIQEKTSNFIEQTQQDKFNEYLQVSHNREHNFFKNTNISNSQIQRINQSPNKNEFLKLNEDNSDELVESQQQLARAMANKQKHDELINTSVNKSTFKQLNIIINPELNSQSESKELNSKLQKSQTQTQDQLIEQNPIHIEISKLSHKTDRLSDLYTQKIIDSSKNVKQIEKATNSESGEEIVEELNIQETDRFQEPQKYKPQQKLIGVVISKKNKKQPVIEIIQKPVQTNEEKMVEITQICKDMGLDEYIVQKKKSETPIIKTASKPYRNTLKSQQSKYITKMMQSIDDGKLEDYFDIIPTFQNLFSGFYNNQPHYNHLDLMREIYGIFQQHIERVDNVDSLLNRYKLNTVAINPNELAYINDPRKLVMYANKTGIDIQQYIQRQMVFNQRLQNEEQKSDLYFRVVKTKEEVYDIITRSFMRKLQWSELPHGIGLKTSWNVLWTWSKPQIDLNKLIYFQKVNHFSFNKNLARKDLLKKNIERCQRLGNKTAQQFDFIPPTFLLPKEYVQFMEKFYKDSESEGSQNIWIMKPTGKSRGRGITVLNDISDVMYAEPVVLQKYLKNPLLLKGHKFDMRIYVLVTQFNPLEVFIYKEGFARLTTQPFTLDITELKNTLIHLTNFAVQRTHVSVQDLDQQLGGCKISLRQLKEKLYDKNVDWNRIWEQVQDIVLKSLVATQSEIPHNPNSFELFGYDIIIDTNHKCWLLEVNSSPSLGREYILDELIKQQLIDDIFDLIQPINYDRQRFCEVLERRIMEEQGCKSAINTMNNSKLQCQRDLNYILRGQHIRRYGEMPKIMGGFVRLAPSEKYDKLKGLVQSYKTINGRGTID